MSNALRGNWLVRRGFLWHGESLKPGARIELADRDAAELLALGRIAAADDATARRVKSRQLVTFNTPRDQIDPRAWNALPSGVARRTRN